ncbi:hypothetical protein BDY19DRAFT_987439 [Irpex rosettiformis]|uniref:Uncharacterized protein n=1 Tax=Irpex rosettiformis TaxID=378272 RepID=A0ACB8TRJ6_9APHY|nr:hypothetical protein BDY19DRAFT_987439 [Irpex rosettiformis]
MAVAMLLVLPYLAHATFMPPHQEPLGFGKTGQEDAHILRRVKVVENSTVTVDDILGVAENFNLDVWQVRSSSVDVHLTSGTEPSFHHFLEGSGLAYTDSALPYSLVHPQSIRPQASAWNLSSLSNSTFHTDYRTIDEIGIFVKQLIDLHPDQARLVPIGHSSEHREMFALEITANRTSLKKKTGFVITGAQHAREWIATSTALFIAHALLADPSESYSMASLLNTFDFYLVLLPNPDGYVYTWETDRFWYKNRQVVGAKAKCVGIDMNRFGYKWKSKAQFPAKNKNKTGTDPCAPWFPGNRAWEAPEVNNIANYITTLPNLGAHIDLRSYGQMISSPFSFSCKRTPKDAEDQLEAALGASQALKAAHGTSFTTGSLCSLLYKAPGNIVDYMYARAGIKFSYAVHLRDTGTYGFVLPPEWIRPVGEETANMIKSLAGFIVGKKCAVTTN